MRAAKSITRFHRDERGLTGAEKALVALLSLGLILLVVRIILGGANQASEEASRVLRQQGGASGGNMPNAATSAGGGGSGSVQMVATPLPSGGSDLDYDGALTGANGASYPPGTPPDQIAPVMPSNGRSNGETIIYVNGISTHRGGHQDSLQSVADKTGSQVIGVYNATEGFVSDLRQCLDDKRDVGTNKAVDTLADTVYDQLAAGKSVHLMGHSQGGLITSRALTDVRNRLMLEDGLTRAQAEERMSHITVETFGAAATRYPDGPRYVHYLNRADPVPNLFGLGEFGNGGAGRDAKVVRFTDPGLSVEFHKRWPWEGSPVTVSYDSHGFEKVYLPRREPID